MKRKTWALFLIFCMLLTFAAMPSIAQSELSVGAASDTGSPAGGGSFQGGLGILALEDTVAYAWNAYSTELPQGVVNVTVPGGVVTSLYPDSVPSGNFMAGGDFVGDTLYMIDFTSPCGLFTVDTTTGVKTLVGNTGLSLVTGFTYDITTDTAYVCTDAHLYEINLENASVTLVGPMANSYLVIAIASNMEGDLYAIDLGNKNLYTLDKTTGTATVVGSLGKSLNYAQDMGFDRNSNILYGSLYDEYGGFFGTIDLTTGAITELNRFNAEIDAFAIPYGTIKAEFYDGDTLLKRTFVVDGLDDVSKPTPTKAGYTFTGWNTAQDGSGTGYDPSDDIFVEEDTIFYAQWSASEYSVAYDGNGATGGTVPADDTVYYMDDQATVLGNTFEKLGYDFMGWNTQADGLGDAYAPEDLLSISGEDVILYAQWTLSEYTVTYNSNGATSGTVPTDSNTYNMEEEVTLLGNPGNLVRTGYTFGGWNTLANGSGCDFEEGDTFLMGTSNATFYAKWIKDPVVINFVEREKDAPAILKGAEGKVLLPEKTAEDTMTITVYLQAKSVELSPAIETIVKQQLKAKGYAPLSVYDLKLMKRIETTGGDTTELVVDNKDITAPVTIRIQLTPEQAAKNNLAMAYLDAGGNATILTSTIVEVDGVQYAEFTTDHFSNYAIVELLDVENPKTGLLEDSNSNGLLLLSLGLFLGSGILMTSGKKAKQVQ